MGHLDAELLSLLALGEPLGNESDAVHLAGCRECSETLEALRHTVLVATADPAGVELTEPGSHNWHAIHQALGLSPSLAADPLRSSAAPAREVRGSRDARGSGAQTVRPAEAPTSSALSSPAPPVPFRAGRRIPGARRSLWITAAAAAGIVLGAAGAWTAASILGRTEPLAAAPAPTAVVLAETPLRPLAAHAASGNAVVQRLPNGTRQLVVRLPDENVSGFREVWVGSADLSKMVSLGVLGNDPGVFVIPSGLDLAQYPVVDISNEPYDGDPAHSAESIARGRLTLAG